MSRLVKDPANDDAWTEVDADSDRSAVLDYLDQMGMGPDECAAESITILVASDIDDRCPRRFTVRPVPARWEVR